MNAWWRLAVLAVALILSTCTAFLVSPTDKFAPRPSSAAAARHHQVLHVPASCTSRAVANAGTCCCLVTYDTDRAKLGWFNGHVQQCKRLALCMVRVQSRLSDTALPAAAGWLSYECLISLYCARSNRDTGTCCCCATSTVVGAVRTPGPS